MISNKATRSRGFLTARGRVVQQQHLIVRLQAYHNVGGFLKHEKDDRCISNP